MIKVESKHEAFDIDEIKDIVFKYYKKINIERQIGRDENFILIVNYKTFYNVERFIIVESKTPFNFEESLILYLPFCKVFVFCSGQSINTLYLK